MSSFVIHEHNYFALIKQNSSGKTPSTAAESFLPPLTAVPGPALPSRHGRPGRRHSGTGHSCSAYPARPAGSGPGGGAASPKRGAAAAGPALTLSESRSGSAWQRRKRKDLGSRQSVCRVVRKQVPPTFSLTHLPGPAPGSGAELHRRQGPPAPRPPAGGTGNSQWFSAAILAAAGRGRPAPGAPPTGRARWNSALPLVARRPSGFGHGCDTAAAPAVPHAPRPTAEGRGGGRAEPYMPLLQTTKHK